MNAANQAAPKSTGLISVVIPTHNRAGLIDRAIRSVQSQTYRDLEVIIIDDGSTDDTRDRIRTLQQADPRIQYISHDKNHGAQAARNDGIHAARGQYIAFLDSDNEWLPRKLERQMALFSDRPDAPGVVYCGYSKVSAAGAVMAEYVPRHRGMLYKRSLVDWITDTSTLIVRRELLENIHGLNDKVRAYHEWDLCIRLARECEFDFVPECLTLYHEHDLPSISKDYLRDAYGYLDVVDTYREEIVRTCGSSTLSEHYLKAGRLFVQAGRFDLARAYFAKSLRSYPLKSKALMHFGASLLGKDVYGALRSYRQS